MINCDSFAQQLSDFIENNISDENSRLLIAHRDSCENCSRLVHNAKRVLKSLKNLSPVAVSPDFNAKLRQKLALERQKPYRWFDSLIDPIRSIGFKPIVATFATAAVIFLVVMVSNTYIFNKDEGVLYSPRIEIPPLPNSNQNATFQQNPLKLNQMQVGGIYFPDSLESYYKNTPGESLLQVDLFKSLRKEPKR